MRCGFFLLSLFVEKVSLGELLAPGRGEIFFGVEDKYCRRNESYHNGDRNCLLRSRRQGGALDRAGEIFASDNKNLHGIFRQKSRRAEEQKSHNAESLRGIVEHKGDEKRHKRIFRENHGARYEGSKRPFAWDD